MKTLVIRTFQDKETKKGYNEGDTYESNDSKRVAFLVEEGFLSKKPKNKVQEEKETIKTMNEIEQE